MGACYPPHAAPASPLSPPPPLTVPDQLGRQPIHWAAHFNESGECCKLLLAAGADPEHGGRSGEDVAKSPLFTARSAEVKALLLAAVAAKKPAVAPLRRQPSAPLPVPTAPTKNENKEEVAAEAEAEAENSKRSRAEQRRAAAAPAQPASRPASPSLSAISPATTNRLSPFGSAPSTPTLSPKASAKLAKSKARWDANLQRMDAARVDATRAERVREAALALEDAEIARWVAERRLASLRSTISPSSSPEDLSPRGKVFRRGAIVETSLLRIRSI